MTDLKELYKEACNQNLKIYFMPMHECVSISLPDGWIGMDVDKIESYAEGTACLAHEMGHVLTGSFYNIYSSVDLRCKHETRADRWAIKKLLPVEELKSAIKEGNTEIWDLAEYFNLPEYFIKKAVEYYTKTLEIKLA